MTGTLEAQVRRILEAHWDADRGYSVPNPAAYPHLWLWDSCFHAVVWAHLGDRRALVELDAVLAGQLAGGLVPHMRFGAAPDTWLGPPSGTSGLAQPPMFGHAIKVLVERGFRPADETIARARRGLDWLWDHRREDHGLLYVVHPWEAGNDHSPRWDGWGAPGRTRHDYDRSARTAWNKERMAEVSFHDDGAAAWSSSLVTCPVGFNAYAAFTWPSSGRCLPTRRWSTVPVASVPRWTRTCGMPSTACGPTCQLWGAGHRPACRSATASWAPW